MGGAQEQGRLVEGRLGSSEVGLTAHSLIQECRHALQRTPEFTLALHNWYFSEAPGKRTIETPIKFRKDDCCYEVQYTTDDEREHLLVIKLPVDPDTSDWLDETITLETMWARRGQFAGGTIQVIKYYKEQTIDDGKIEGSTNTYAAVHKVREFITENF